MIEWMVKSTSSMEELLGNWLSRVVMEIQSVLLFECLNESDHWFKAVVTRLLSFIAVKENAFVAAVLGLSLCKAARWGGCGWGGGLVCIWRRWKGECKRCVGELDSSIASYQ
ncbi:unnamed protein product [Prunus armeniaca]